MNFTCSICGKEKPEQTNGGTGYATAENNAKVCYSCCAFEDRAYMLQNDRTTLYLSKNEKGFNRVTNWPSTLEIKPSLVRKGSHNIAGTRYDVWFHLDGRAWHGVQYGEMSQLLRCRAIKH